MIWIILIALIAMLVLVGMISIIESLIGNLVANVAGNLLSNQIEAWLPGLSRRIVRWAAALMGSRAPVCEAQWLEQLELKTGGLVKLGYALGTFRMPFRTVFIRWYFASVSQRAAWIAAWAKHSAWVLPVVAIVVLLVKYPPHESRYPAYTVLIPPLLCCSLGLSRRARRIIGYAYDWLSRPARIAVGSLTVPFVAVLAVALGLVPAAGQSPFRAGSPPDDSSTMSRGATSVKLVFESSAELKSSLRDTSSTRKTNRVKPHHGVPFHDAELLSRQPGPQSVPISPYLAPSRLIFSDLPVLPIPVQPIPPQPIPVPAPSAPQNVRIVAGGG